MNFDLNYHISGKGIPFVFQHGLGASLEHAVKLMGDLENTQLISIDNNGHGKSTLAPNVTPSFNLYADNLIRLLDKMNIETAIFGGISMGSGIALNLAIRHPERVKGLILVRPAWLHQPSPQNLNILLQVADYLDNNKSVADFKQYPNFQAFRAKSEGASQSVLGMFNRVQGQNTSTVLKAMVNDKPFEDNSQLQNIHQPCLIIASENDPLHPFSMGLALQTLIPNADLKKVVARYINDGEHHQKVRGYTSTFIKKYF